MSSPNIGRRAAWAGALWCVAFVSVVGASGAVAQSSSGGTRVAWPTHPVKLISPFPPGGGTDAFARPLAKALSQSLGVSVVVDNRGGAGGTLGAELAAKSAPDGYTFLIGAVHHAIAVSMYSKLGYDLRKDLTPVTVLALVPNVVVINPTRLPGIKTWQDFHTYVKANPGKLNYASAGNGTAHHLAVEMYKTMTRSYVAHIPYRGAGPAVQDLLAGQVDFMFDGLGSSMPYIRAGKFLPLAVTSAKRSFALPELPTLQEGGVSGYEAQSWYAVWAPTGAPSDIVNRMQAAVVDALASDELKQAWRLLGAEAGGQSPAETGQFIDQEIRKWAQVVKESGAKVD